MNKSGVTAAVKLAQARSVRHASVVQTNHSFEVCVRLRWWARLLRRRVRAHWVRELDKHVPKTLRLHVLVH